MYRRVKNYVIGIALMSCLSSLPGFAQVATGQKVETTGMILTREGENLTMDTKDLGKLEITLTDNTRVQVPKGIFRHSDMEMTSLLPGLEIEVKGTGGANGQVVADTVRFTKESLKVANQIRAGVAVTKAQAEANKQNIDTNKQNIDTNKQGIDVNKQSIEQNRQEVEQQFDDLTKFDVKKELAINFETGKAVIPADAQQQLIALANEAKGMKGYLVDVKGFASTSGDAVRNQQLSEDRAEAVVTVLHQQGVPLKNIVTPAAMGTTNPVATNNTDEGRLQNQRVEVKVLVNRSLARR